jgi:hypothetical protein
VRNMATAVRLAPSTGPGTFVEPRTADSNQQVKHDVATVLNYNKDPGDGSSPRPTIAGSVFLVRLISYVKYGC